MKRYIRRFSDDFSAICQNNESETMIINDTGFGILHYSYGQIRTYVERYIELFKENGLKQGDIILSLTPNSVETIVCFFAVLKGGYTFAPLPCNATEREIEKWTSIINPGLIIRKTEIGLPVSIESLYKVIAINCDGNFDWLPLNDQNVMEHRSGKIYLFTSGTTGTPKAMVLDGDTLWSSGYLFMKYYHLEESKCRFWNYLPMSYLGGLFNLALIPLSCGGSFLITEPFSGKTVLNFWGYVQKHKITALWFVPTIINALLKVNSILKNNFRDYTSSKLKIALLGTAPITKEVKEKFEKELGIPIYENYALSETTFITGESIESLCYREQSSVGEVLPYVDFELKQYESSDIYEFWVKTPFMFEGYLNENGKIDFPVDNNGYFNTKDLVRISDSGQIVIIGRDRDIIKKGGLFVSLNEIENIVKNLDYIKEVAAIPIKHDFYGESYILGIVFKNPDENEEKAISDLKLWLIDNIVQYKLPEKIISYKNFPHTDSGKLKKEELRKNYENE